MSLLIESVKISAIQRAKYNPRKALKPGDPAYDRLKKAVDTFGLVEPLIWNKRTGNLVGGHQRLSIIEARGDSTVEVSVVDLADREEKALNLALNKHSGEWDFATLADVLQELDAGDMDMDLTGFSASELERLMTWTAPNAGLTDENAVPEPPKEPIAKPGDLWLLGKHRVLCGDSTVATDVERLLAGVVPNLMVTDPPYGVNYDPTWRAAAGVNKSMGKMGKVENDDRADWTEAWALFPGNIAYVWHGGLHASEVHANLTAVGFDVRSQIIWAKDRFALSRGQYHWQHEPCWYAVRRGHKADWCGKRNQSTYWKDNLGAIGERLRAARLSEGWAEISAIAEEVDALIQSTVWPIPAREDGGRGHGTQKPVECMRRPMLNNSNPGQAVYDPFLGSGTTVIAAESTGRIAYGIEINPAYMDVIVKRWSDFTGKKAELATGESVA